MISRKQTLAGLSLALIVASSASAHAAGLSVFGSKKKDINAGKKLTPAQSALIDKSVVREKQVIKVLKERAPLVETYIQNMKPDPVMRQVPESDQHFLGRVEFGKVINDTSYQDGPKAGGKQSKIGGILHSSTSFLGGLGGSLHLQFHESGFVQMLLMDSIEYDKQHYNFGFVRTDFLGNIKTAVFDVTPINSHKTGAFFGRIWIETQNGNVVRFNGDFAGSEKDYEEFFHFDSWRTNVQPDLWLPTSFYVEESDPKSQTSTLKFKAINYVWGYALKVPPATAENNDLEIEGVNDSTQAQDLSPLAAQRQFIKQAEDNIVERLFQAGLLDAPSDFDKQLETLANNILAYNNLIPPGAIHVRTLLTEPLESLSVGNTIILSKSLIDTTAVQTSDGVQLGANLYAVLSFQLAHIISGHRLDTKFAFNDRMLFPDNAAFRRIPMHHTDADNTEAAKKAVELLNAKPTIDDPSFTASAKYFGLYLQQLQQRVKGLHALNEPMIGDGLVKSDTDSSFWLQALVPKGDKLDVKDLKQQAAEPLSSFLRFDPWTDQVIQLHTALDPILSASDKMPFEVAPIYIKLGYYKAPVDPAATPATAPPADPNATPAPTTAPASPAPATPSPTQK